MSDFIAYMERTRHFYRAQGFQRDYVWAHHDDTPFTRLLKPLNECNVTVVTTAVTHRDIPKPIRKAESIPFRDMPQQFSTDEVAWDKEVTHTDDRESYFPMATLTALAEAGEIGGIAPRYHFVPTQYSHRITEEEDAPAIRDACLQDQVDIALLVPL